MEYITFHSKELAACVIESSLRHDEKVACHNATVIVNNNGEVTAWFDNNAPVCLITEK